MQPWKAVMLLLWDEIPKMPPALQVLFPKRLRFALEILTSPPNPHLIASPFAWLRTWMFRGKYQGPPAGLEEPLAGAPKKLLGWLAELNPSRFCRRIFQQVLFLCLVGARCFKCFLNIIYFLTDPQDYTLGMTTREWCLFLGWVETCWNHRRKHLRAFHFAGNM